MEMKDISRELLLSVESRTYYHIELTTNWGPVLVALNITRWKHVEFCLHFWEQDIFADNSKAKRVFISYLPIYSFIVLFSLAHVQELFFDLGNKDVRHVS